VPTVDVEVIIVVPHDTGVHEQHSGDGNVHHFRVRDTENPRGERCDPRFERLNPAVVTVELTVGVPPELTRAPHSETNVTRELAELIREIRM
jgi:hypothetical protein